MAAATEILSADRVGPPPHAFRITRSVNKLASLSDRSSALGVWVELLWCVDAIARVGDGIRFMGELRRRNASA